MYDFISYVCNACLTFWSIFYKLCRFYEEIDLKWQIYHLDSWNLVQNCPTASSYRTISHCLTILSYIVYKTLNVKKGYPYQTKISFRLMKFDTKLSYSLLWQKYISLFHNHFIHSFQDLKCKGRLPPPQIYQNSIIAQRIAYGGLYLLSNFCITQIELELNAKHRKQIHQWNVGVIGFTNVH